MLSGVFFFFVCVWFLIDLCFQPELLCFLIVEKSGGARKRKGVEDAFVRFVLLS